MPEQQPTTTAAPTSTPVGPIDSQSDAHLGHPERWATGSDPATTKQKGFIDALERQKDLSIGEERKENLSKSEASVIIDGLQQSKVIPVATAESNGETTAEPKRKRDDEENEEEKKDDAADVKAGGEGEGDTPVPVLDAADSKVASDASPSSNGISYEKKDGKDASKRSENASTADEKAGDVDDKAPPAKKAKTDDAAPSASTTTNDVDPTGPESSILKEDAVAADGSALPPFPKDHLDHADKWVTGDDPATEKQLAYLKVLEKKHSALSEGDAQLGKSEASEKIDRLKDA